MHATALHTPLDNKALERRTLHSWFLLAAVSLVSTLGLAVAVAPVLSVDSLQFWPWAHTPHALLAGLSAALIAMMWYLTNQQLQIARLRARMHDMQAQQMEQTKTWALSLEHSNSRLNAEARVRMQVETDLRILNDSLEEQVNNRTAVIRAQSEALDRAKKSLEIQNQHLRDLYRTAHEFVDNVSHDFRTPLTVIREYAATMSEGLMGPTTQEQGGCLNTIIARVSDLIVMVTDLLDISRIEGNILMTSRRTWRPGDVIESVLGILERKAATSEVTLTVEGIGSLPLVYCDREKVGRIVINLVVNAIKFSPPGKEIVLWGRVADDGNNVVIGVTDLGIGIPPQRLEEIFDRFKQLDRAARSYTKGFGLGLSIVKELVQLHFGVVQVQSAIDKGSTFSFTLPLADPTKLLPTYLDRALQMREPAEQVSLIQVSVASENDRALADEVTYFLESHMRRVDLLFPLQNGQWLLVGVTGNDGADRFIARLEAARLQDSSKSENPTLPELQWSVQGSWRIDTQAPDFIRCFLELYQD